MWASDRIGIEILPLLGVLDGVPGIAGPTALLARQRFVQPDGTFRIPQAVPARYMLTMVLPRGLHLESARLGERDNPGKPFEIPDASESLGLRVSGNGGTLEGIVVDQSGASTPGARVVLLPPSDFRSDQTAYKIALTDPDRSFSIPGIRPGRHLALAFEAIEPNAWLNEALMAPLQGSGFLVDVSPNTRTRRELIIIPAEDLRPSPTRQLIPAKESILPGVID